MDQMAAQHAWHVHAIPAVVHPILVHITLLYDTKGQAAHGNVLYSGDYTLAGVPQNVLHVDSAPHHAMTLRQLHVPHHARHDTPNHPESKKHWYDSVKSVGKDIAKGVEHAGQAAASAFGAYGAYTAATASQVAEAAEATAWAAEPLLLTL